MKNNNLNDWNNQEEEWEDAFNSSIPAKPILQTSQIKRIFKTIDTTNSFVLLYGMEESFRTYIATCYNQKFPAYIGKDSQVKNPCVKITLDRIVLDTSTIDAKIGKECFATPQTYNDTNKIYNLLKNLDCKNLIVENSDYLFKMGSIDLVHYGIKIERTSDDLWDSETTVDEFNTLKKIKNNNINYFYHLYKNLGIKIIFSGLNATQNFLEGCTYKTDIGNNKFPYKKIKCLSKTTNKDYDTIFEFIQKDLNFQMNKLLYDDIKEFCLNEEMNIKETLETFKKCYQISKIAEMENINLTLFKNCFYEFISKERTELLHSSFLSCS
ncbi:hypothetical protein [Chryseobacterium mulctrae]|uniref:hypothetical protein n=1 Tax=Chryseobacterium mulctrae TaxID=2576777 RepID=UPI00111799A5|nr:hypothetical protein [Chryseobacterium mulctrae]